MSHHNFCVCSLVWKHHVSHSLVMMNSVSMNIPVLVSWCSLYEGLSRAHSEEQNCRVTGCAGIPSYQVRPNGFPNGRTYRVVHSIFLLSLSPAVSAVTSPSSVWVVLLCFIFSSWVISPELANCISFRRTNFCVYWFSHLNLLVCHYSLLWPLWY